MHGRSSHPLFERRATQQGIALPTVLLLGVVMFMIVATVAMRSLTGLNQSTRDRSYNEALQLTDGALDKVLYQVVDTKANATGYATMATGTKPTEYATATPTVAGGVPDTDQPMPDGADERAWAIQMAMLKNPSGTTPAADAVSKQFPDLVAVHRGEWAVVKPAGKPVVYAVGFVPDRTNPKTTRVLRIEYDFPPFSAVNAILTGGNIKIGGSAEVSGANGSIHTNGNFAWQGGGHSISGQVTASGTYQPGGNVGNSSQSGGGKAVQQIPDTNPALNFRFAQFVLCPNGTAVAGPTVPASYGVPPSTKTSQDPCTGASPLPMFGTTFNGWSYSPPKNGAPARWSYNTSLCYNGVYYVHHGSVSIGGNPGKDTGTCGGEPWKVTLLVAAENLNAPELCKPAGNAIGGDIDIQGTPRMKPYPIQVDVQVEDKVVQRDLGILMQAGRDFSLKGNGNANSEIQGAITVTEQFDLSGNMSLNGNLIATDKCDTPGSPVGQNSVNLSGSSQITFNSPAELPLGNLVRITRWSEL